MCFDIGAHLGNRTAAWSALGAEVIAIEPQPACLNFLERKFKNNAKVKLLPIALGQNQGTVDFQISSMNPSVSTLADEQFHQTINQNALIKSTWDQTIQVPMWTLDAIIEKFGMPSFCKIDVEGFEKEVLLGLSVAPPCLSFEFFNTRLQNLKDCLNIINQLGLYQYNWSIGESQQFEEKDWNKSEVILTNLSARKGQFSGDIYAKRVN